MTCSFLGSTGKGCFGSGCLISFGASVGNCPKGKTLPDFVSPESGCVVVGGFSPAAGIKVSCFCWSAAGVITLAGSCCCNSVGFQPFPIQGGCIKKRNVYYCFPCMQPME